MTIGGRARADLGEDAALPVHVNISPRQLAQADFADGLERVLYETETPPQDVALEITEHALLRDEEAAGRTLDAIRSLGVRIVLDDFGTGYSSLSHLNRFPLDAIKV